MPGTRCRHVRRGRFRQRRRCRRKGRRLRGANAEADGVVVIVHGVRAFGTRVVKLVPLHDNGVDHLQGNGVRLRSMTRPPHNNATTPTHHLLLVTVCTGLCTLPTPSETIDQSWGDAACSRTPMCETADERDRNQHKHAWQEHTVRKHGRRM